MSTNLTDDELMAMWSAESVPNRTTSEFVRAFARAAIAADRSRRASSAAAVPGWMPIETAPADMAEHVVVRWVDSDGDEMRQFDRKEDGCWMSWHDHAEHVEIIGGHGVSYTPPYEHWMPLPAPPAARGIPAESGREG
jgi:hypothetical protein